MCSSVISTALIRTNGPSSSARQTSQATWWVLTRTYTPLLTLRLSDSLTRAALVQRSQDPALRSRFSANIEFGLPDEQCRVEILKQYSQQLSEDDVRTLAKATAGFSGRDLRDACSYAERHWATCIIKGAVKDGSTPGLKVYLEAVRARRA